jgi:hypothetical protein
LSKPKPELKQFGELSPADFERHPVWIACHTEDFVEPWFNEADEETFRPWTDALPVGPSDGMLLVRARFELHDGSHYDGFLTPAFKEGEIGALHPHLFAGGQSFGFSGAGPDQLPPICGRARPRAREWKLDGLRTRRSNIRLRPATC